MDKILDIFRTPTPSNREEAKCRELQQKKAWLKGYGVRKTSLHQKVNAYWFDILSNLLTGRYKYRLWLIFGRWISTVCMNKYK